MKNPFHPIPIQRLHPGQPGWDKFLEEHEETINSSSHNHIYGGSYGVTGYWQSPSYQQMTST